MSAMRKFSGVALATAAAFAFSTVAVTTASAAEEAKVKCEGVNSCAGTSACKPHQRVQGQEQLCGQRLPRDEQGRVRRREGRQGEAEE